MPNVQERLLPLLVLLSLIKPSCQSVRGAPPGKQDPVQASSGAALLASIHDDGVESIALTGDVFLKATDTEPYALPLVLAANRSLVITTVAGTGWQTLDFGGVLELLYLEPDSLLTFKGLVVQGAAPPSKGHDAMLAAQVGGSPFWPTVNGAPGHQMTLQDVELEKIQVGCTADAIASKATTLQRMLGRNDTVSHRDTTLVIADTLSFPALVIDPLTEVQLGVATLQFTNVVITCEEDPAANATSPGPESSLDVEPIVPLNEVVQVMSDGQLLSALNSTLVRRIELAGDVKLTPQAMKPYEMPLGLLNGRTLTISSAGGAMRTLNFGQVLRLIYLSHDSRLAFENLELQGADPPSHGYAAGLTNEVKGPTVLWPTVDGFPGYQVTYTNVTLHSIQAGCSPNLTTNQAATLQHALGDNGTVAYNGTTLEIRNALTISVPMTNRVTKEQLGVAIYSLSNVTITCTPDLASSPDAPNSGGGGPSWIWPVVGTLAGLAAAGGAAAALLVWRHQRRRQAVVCKRSEGAEEGGSGDKLVGALSCLVPSGEPLKELEAGEASVELLLQQQSGSGRINCGRGDDEATGLGAPLWQTRVGVIEGLEIFEMLGRGSFGRCYKGRWKGCLVAVKIIEHCITEGKESDLAREPLMSMSVSHPSVVMTYKLSVLCVKPAVQHTQHSLQGSDRVGSQDGSGQHEDGLGPNTPSMQRSSGGGSGAGRWGGGQEGSGRGSGRQGSGGLGSGGRAGGALQQVQSLRAITSSSSAALAEVVSPQDGLPPGLYETWLVLEYMDRGNLTDAISAGKFISPLTRKLDMALVLLTLLDVAHAMEYLHGINIIHGDLKGRNVLIKSTRRDRRGFVAKVSDFGLSRMLPQHQTHISTQSYGTATHASPELLQHGKLTKAADVYAFGIIVYELVAGEEAYTDMNALQVIVQVSQNGNRPPVPPNCPTPLADLMQQCWQTEPEQRPTSSQVVQKLRGMLLDLKRSLPDRSRTDPPLPLAPRLSL